MLYLQGLAWITQFIGHGSYEERAPALITNFFFIFLAPFFAALHLLEIFVGYHPDELVKFNEEVYADIAYYR